MRSISVTTTAWTHEVRLGLRAGGDASDVPRGMRLLTELREMCDRRQFFKTELPILDLFAAREDALDGNVGAALPVMRAAVGTVFGSGQLTFCSGLPACWSSHS